MISATTTRLIEEIYRDSDVSPREVIELREAADLAVERVLAADGSEGVVEALAKSFDVTTQLLQEVALRFARSDYTDLARATVMSMAEAHIALLQATVDAVHR